MLIQVLLRLYCILVVCLQINQPCFMFLAWCHYLCISEDSVGYLWQYVSQLSTIAGPKSVVILEICHILHIFCSCHWNVEAGKRWPLFCGQYFQISFSSKMISVVWFIFHWIGPIFNESVLVKVMAWCWTSDKPLPEPLLTKFYDAKWCR